MEKKKYYHKIKNYYIKFKTYNIAIKLIIINLFIYLICEFVEIFFGKNPRIYFGLSSSFSSLITYPWSFFTNVFFHKGINHILVDSLLLFSTGRLFLNLFDEKSFLKFYFLGVLGASFSYFIGIYLLKEERMLYGSSGAVFCLFFALIAYNSNMKLSLPFLGGLEIKYIGLILFFLSFEDKGANLSHLGGAFMGFFYMKRFKRGKDFLGEFCKINFLNFIKIKKNNKKHINKILDKISNSGYESLSEKEKKALFEK